MAEDSVTGAAAGAGNGNGTGVVTPPAAVPNPTEWVTKTFTQDTLNETQAYEKLKAFKGPDDVLRSYISLEKKMSSTGRLPSPEAPKEEWDSFYKAYGRPDDAKGYVIPDEIKAKAGDEQFLGGVLSMAHSLGLNQNQTKQMLEWGVGQSEAIEKMQKDKVEADKVALKNEWGYAYEDNLGIAQQTFNKFVGGRDDPAVKFLNESGFASDPRVIKLFHKIGAAMGEGRIVNGAKLPDADVASAQQKIGEMRGDPKSPFNDATHPNHKSAVQEMQRLYGVVAGG